MFYNKAFHNTLNDHQHLVVLTDKKDRIIAAGVFSSSDDATKALAMVDSCLNAEPSSIRTKFNPEDDDQIQALVDHYTFFDKADDEDDDPRDVPAGIRKPVTISSFRAQLISVGEQAACVIREGKGGIADQYKKEFERLLEQGKTIFQPVHWDDITTEVICHLRLKYGKWITEWLAPEYNTYALPF